MLIAYAGSNFLTPPEPGTLPSGAALESSVDTPTAAFNAGLFAAGAFAVIAVIVFQLFLAVPLIAYAVAAGRNQHTSVKHYLRHWKRGFGLLAMMLLLGLAVMLGFIALIIPGVILLVLFTIWYFQAPFIYVDQDVGVFDALRESKRRSRETKMGLEHLGIVGAVQLFSLPVAVPLLGFVYLLFFTPVSLIAYAYRYTSAQALIESSQAKPATSPANLVLLLVGIVASVLIFAAGFISNVNDTTQEAQRQQQLFEGNGGVNSPAGPI